MKKELVVLAYYPADVPRVFGPFSSLSEAIKVMLGVEVWLDPAAPEVYGRKVACLVPDDRPYEGPEAYSIEVLEDPRVVFGIQ